MTTTDLAPIVLFVYNRPWHTQQTLDALKQNELAPESVLYVFSDGAKSGTDAEQFEKIAEVRRIIHSVNGFKDIIIKESEVNKGLANSIIEGVTEVINKHGKVIVLEDDLVTSKFFLRFMNEALEFYKSYKSVFSISANCPPLPFKLPIDYPYSVFVSLRFYSTGWGSWSDRWEQVSWDNSFINQTEEAHAFKRGGEDLTSMLTDQQLGKIDSWAIRFQFAHFKNHSISIMACNPYIFNIGFDGTGIHSGFISQKDMREQAISHSILFETLYEDSRFINAFYIYYYQKKRPLWKKMVNRLSRILGGNNVFTIKQKVYQ